MTKFPKSIRFFESMIPGTYKYYAPGFVEEGAKRKEYTANVTVFAGSGTDTSGQWFFKFQNDNIGSCRKQIEHDNAYVCNLKFDKNKIQYQDDVDAENDAEYKEMVEQLDKQEQSLRMKYDNAVASDNPDIAQSARQLGYARWKDIQLGNECFATESVVKFVQGAYTYFKTISTAYRSTDFKQLGLKTEPWLHIRFVSLTKAKTDNIKETEKIAWYAITYVWDTREVVEWKEIKNADTVNKQPALDNCQTLVDNNKIVPAWATDLLKHKQLYNMANQPQEVQDAYYSFR